MAALDPVPGFSKLSHDRILAHCVRFVKRALTTCDYALFDKEMSELVIDTRNIDGNEQFVGPLREEFEAAGISRGRFAVGNISALPKMVYFLWHDDDDAPVSMLIPRESFENEPSTRQAARVFVSKWKIRPGCGATRAEVN